MKPSSHGHYDCSMRNMRNPPVDADSVKCIDQSLDWYIVKCNSFPLDFRSDTDVCDEKISVSRQ
jgi:hypothetical protein